MSSSASGVKFVFPLICRTFPDLKELPLLEGFRIDLVGLVTCVIEDESSLGGCAVTGDEIVKRCDRGRCVKIGVWL